MNAKSYHVHAGKIEKFIRAFEEDITEPFSPAVAEERPALGGKPGRHGTETEGGERGKYCRYR